ncbi:FAD-binding domain-containing protein [Durotheca rogersii]|uniref:FAD-binding domain-containing protein n=1 Tax=Durotheca rogersii TaxID=419775 RepID=UPI00221FE96A|nr:FAD-binding domain-containing protein [Durotheca rogersii]KAI5866128.1 FAD-binding domain-containing protein [Durotheca rogersii]
MRALLALILFALYGYQVAICLNFPFEAEQLTKDDIGDFRDIDFANETRAGSVQDGPDCREYPGTPNWPLEEEWLKLNRSLGGALIKGIPPAAVCYDGPYKDEDACSWLVRNASSTRFYINDPVTVLTEWPVGDPCHATLTPQGATCTQGAFPEYVVNVSTVRQIQVAVNFARNRNLRLVIKNTGHEFVGRSSGFGSLSIWTHWLKDFEFLPQYQIGPYQDSAARVASGIESWEMFAHMQRHNMTTVVAGGYTVGAYGGWIAGGGHSALASKYGLGADQPLSIQVVTADGRFVTADPFQNQDLFFALRGGGGSTFGVVTSAIVKVHPPTTVLSSSVAFSVSQSEDVEKFWTGFDIYHEFGKNIVDNNGTACYVSRRPGNDSFGFTTDIELPDVSDATLAEFVRPLLEDLRAAGLDVTSRAPTPAANWMAPATEGRGDVPSSGRFGSRLLPRASFEGGAAFARTQAALRRSIEAGYTFHGIHLAPTEAAAGAWPGDSAANPAFRRAVIHADLFDPTALRGLGPAAFQAAHARLAAALDEWRAASPGAGAYINESDVEEPDWQQAFFGGGDRYARLLAVKHRRDPWGVFYAPTTVGSEAWVVSTPDGMPTQNGPLCRASAVQRRRRGETRAGRAREAR